MDLMRRESRLFDTSTLIVHAVLGGLSVKDSDLCQPSRLSQSTSKSKSERERRPWRNGHACCFQDTHAQCSSSTEADTFAALRPYETFKLGASTLLPTPYSVRSTLWPSLTSAWASLPLTVL